MSEEELLSEDEELLSDEEEEMASGAPVSFVQQISSFFTGGSAGARE